MRSTIRSRLDRRGTPGWLEQPTEGTAMQDEQPDNEHPREGQPTQPPRRKGGRG